MLVMYWPIWQYKAMIRSPAAASRIHESLDTALARKRVVLWCNFLLYLPSAKPPEPDNWLLDLLLGGHAFTADRAALDIQEAGLTLEFKGLAQQPPAIDTLLLHAFSQLDPANPEPNLHDFAVALFNSVSSMGPSGDLLLHARVFLSVWKGSLSSRPAFEQWSDDLAGTLQVEAQLTNAPESYEVIERFVVCRLLQRFQGEASDGELLRADSRSYPIAGCGWRRAIASSAVMSCITACMPERID